MTSELTNKECETDYVVDVLDHQPTSTTREEGRLQQQHLHTETGRTLHSHETHRHSERGTRTIGLRRSGPGEVLYLFIFLQF